MALRPWAPSDYSGQTYWFDPTHGPSIDVTGEEINTWEDRIATVDPLTFAASGATRPNLVNDGTRNYVDADFGDIMSATAPVNFLPNGGFGFFVEDYDHPAPIFAAPVLASWGTGGNDLTPRAENNETDFQMSFGSSNNAFAPPRLVTGGAFAFGWNRNTSTKNIWMILSVPGKMELWKNGVLVWDDTTGNNVAWNTLFRLFSNGAQGRSCKLYQLVVAGGEPSIAERQIFEGWGAEAAGAQGRLSDLHPYATTAPTILVEDSGAAFGGGGSLLQSRIRLAIASGFKEKLLIGTLSRVTDSGVDAFGDPVVGAAVNYRCEGFIDQYSDAYRVAAGIPETDAKVVLILGNTEVEPQKNDSVNFPNFGTYKLRGSIKIDPARASAECQAFRV